MTDQTTDLTMLPPDPETMNAARAGLAECVVRHFQSITGPGAFIDLEDVLSDLLCDLMHWSDRQGFDFDAALRRAHGHHDAETCGEAGHA
jgi:hypothetical protein